MYSFHGIFWVPVNYHETIYMCENIFAHIIGLVLPNTDVIFKLCLLETKLPQSICKMRMEHFTWWTQYIQSLPHDYGFTLVLYKFWSCSLHKHRFICICIWKRIPDITTNLLCVCLVNNNMYMLYTNVIDCRLIYWNVHDINYITTTHQSIFSLLVRFYVKYHMKCGTLPTLSWIMAFRLKFKTFQVHKWIYSLLHYIFPQRIIILIIQLLGSNNMLCHLNTVLKLLGGLRCLILGTFLSPA